MRRSIYEDIPWKTDSVLLKCVVFVVYTFHSMLPICFGGFIYCLFIMDENCYVSTNVNLIQNKLLLNKRNKNKLYKVPDVEGVCNK